MYVISRKRLDEMYARGWKHRFPNIGESTEDVMKRLEGAGYAVKAYYITTRVKGYYDGIILYKRKEKS